MMLPKGSEAGTVYQLFFFIYPITQQVVTEDAQLRHAAVKPYGYPLERNLKYDSVLDVPNAQFQDVKIFHKDIYELNVQQKQQEP